MSPFHLNHGLEEATIALEQQDSLKLYHEVRATAKKRRDTCSCAMFADPSAVPLPARWLLSLVVLL